MMGASATLLQDPRQARLAAIDAELARRRTRLAEIDAGLTRRAGPTGPMAADAPEGELPAPTPPVQPAQPPQPVQAPPAATQAAPPRMTGLEDVSGALAGRLPAPEAPRIVEPVKFAPVSQAEPITPTVPKAAGPPTDAEVQAAVQDVLGRATSYTDEVPLTADSRLVKALEAPMREEMEMRRGLRPRPGGVESQRPPLTFGESTEYVGRRLAESAKEAAPHVALALAARGATLPVTAAAYGLSGEAGPSVKKLADPEAQAWVDWATGVKPEQPDRLTELASRAGPIANIAAGLASMAPAVIQYATTRRFAGDPAALFNIFQNNMASIAQERQQRGQTVGPAETATDLGQAALQTGLLAVGFRRFTAMAKTVGLKSALTRTFEAGLSAGATGGAVNTIGQVGRYIRTDKPVSLQELAEAMATWALFGAGAEGAKALARTLLPAKQTIQPSPSVKELAAEATHRELARAQREAAETYRLVYGPNWKVAQRLGLLESPVVSEGGEVVGAGRGLLPARVTPKTAAARANMRMVPKAAPEAPAVKPAAEAAPESAPVTESPIPVESRRMTVPARQDAVDELAALALSLNMHVRKEHSERHDSFYVRIASKPGKAPLWIRAASHPSGNKRGRVQLDLGQVGGVTIEEAKGAIRRLAETGERPKVGKLAIAAEPVSDTRLAAAQRAGEKLKVEAAPEAPAAVKPPETVPERAITPPESAKAPEAAPVAETAAKPEAPAVEAGKAGEPTAKPRGFFNLTAEEQAHVDSLHQRLVSQSSLPLLGGDQLGAALELGTFYLKKSVQAGLKWTAKAWKAAMRTGHVWSEEDLKLVWGLMKDIDRHVRKTQTTLGKPISPTEYKKIIDTVTRTGITRQRMLITPKQWLNSVLSGMSKAAQDGWIEGGKAKLEELKRQPEPTVKQLIAAATQTGMETQDKALLDARMKGKVEQARESVLVGEKELVGIHRKLADYAKEQLGPEADKIMSILAKARTDAEQAHVVAAIDIMKDNIEARGERTRVKDLLKELGATERELEEPYRALATDILDATQGSTPMAATIDKLRARTEYLATNADAQLTMPPRYLEELQRLVRTPVSALTPDDARALGDRIEWLLEFSAKKTDARMRVEHNRLVKAGATITEEVAAAHERLPEWKQKTVGIARWLWRSETPLDSVLRGWGLRETQRVMVRDLIDAQDANDRISVPARERVDAVARRELGGPLGDSRVETVLNRLITVQIPGSRMGGKRVDSLKMSVRDLAGLAIQHLDPRTRRASLGVGWNFDIEAVKGADRPGEGSPNLYLSAAAAKGLKDQVPASVWHIAEAIHAEYQSPERRAALDREWFLLMGRHLRLTADYEPSHRNRMAAQTNIPENWQAMVRSIEDAGPFQERTGGPTPFLVRDPFAEFLRLDPLFAAVESGQAMAIRRAGVIAGMPAVKQAIMSRLGRSRLDQLNDHLRYVSGAATNMGELERGVGKYTGRAARAYVVGNPKTWLIQPFSSVLALAQYDPRDVATAVAEYASHPLDWQRQMLAENPSLRKRYAHQLQVMLGGPHGQTRAGGYLSELGARVAGWTFGWGDKKALTLQWLAEKAEAKRMGKTDAQMQSDWNYRRQLAAPADSPAMRTPLEIAASRNPFVQTFSLFRNYISRARMLLIVTGREALREDTPGAWHRFARVLSGYIIAQAMVGATSVFMRRMRRLGKPPDKDEIIKGLTDMGMAFLHPLAVPLSQAFRALGSYARGQDPDMLDEPFIAVVAEMVKLGYYGVGAARKLIAGADSPKKERQLRDDLLKAAEAAYNTTGLSTGGLPVSWPAYIKSFLREPKPVRRLPSPR